MVAVLRPAQALHQHSKLCDKQLGSGNRRHAACMPMERICRSALEQ